MSRYYLHGLRSVLQTVALPYGYTVTVWSSGQELVHRHGLPTVWEIFLFAAGAVAGFAALRTLTPDPAGESAPQLGSTPHGARALVVQAAAVGAAIGAATLIGLIDAAVAWPLAGFAATAAYLTVIALEPALRALRSGG